MYFISVGNEINSSQNSNETAPHIKTKLSDTSLVLIINEKSFEFRRLFCYGQGLNRLRNSVGHYYIYGTRRLTS